MRIFTAIVLLGAATAYASDVSFKVDAKAEMARLLKACDSDRDLKITVKDSGCRSFWLRSGERRLEAVGAYYLSNLLQELALASERGGAIASEKSGAIAPERVFEKPVERLSREIRERFWDGLTRRIDEGGLARALTDSKAKPSAQRILYVPADDRDATEYFEKVARENPALRFAVRPAPSQIDEQAILRMRERPGLLSLALRARADGVQEGVPFVVPGGRFNEMYGWDSYFEALGLIADGRADLARAMVDNFVYEIERYGMILNANRSYYLNRSQPPFLTSMASAVWEASAKGEADKEWLARALRAAMKEYRTVWLAPARLTKTGLSRYFGVGRGIPRETEPNAFDFVLKPAARRRKMSVARLRALYDQGKLKAPELDAHFEQDLAVRESGHDTTYRWRKNGEDRAADFVTVDLNSLLYKYEIDFARLISSVYGGRLEGDADGVEGWLRRARERKQIMLKLLWDPERAAFFDYDFVAEKRSRYLSATAFYPLWAQDLANPSTRILDSVDAARSARALTSALEEAGGLAATARSSQQELFGRARPPARQWEWPNGWAPHQMIAWEALRSYGLDDDADRLQYKWLYQIARNAADFNGVVPEKFDVVARSHAVFAEYGNEGVDFSYITREGFGWMNASFAVGLAALDARYRSQLDRLEPSEWIEFTGGAKPRKGDEKR